jgi:hypothetical protein
MAGRDGNLMGQWDWKTLWTCAHHPENQNHEKQIFERTYKALRSSQALLENAEKLLQRSRIISGVNGEERKISPPREGGAHSKQLTAAQRSSPEA